MVFDRFRTGSFISRNGSPRGVPLFSHLGSLEPSLSFLGRRLVVPCEGSPPFSHNPAGSFTVPFLQAAVFPSMNFRRLLQGLVIPSFSRFSLGTIFPFSFPRLPLSESPPFSPSHFQRDDLLLRSLPETLENKSSPFGRGCFFSKATAETFLTHHLFPPAETQTPQRRRSLSHFAVGANGLWSQQRPFPPLVASFDCYLSVPSRGTILFLSRLSFCQFSFLSGIGETTSLALLFFSESKGVPYRGRLRAPFLFFFCPSSVRDHPFFLTTEEDFAPPPGQAFHFLFASDTYACAPRRGCSTTLRFSAALFSPPPSFPLVFLREEEGEPLPSPGGRLNPNLWQRLPLCPFSFFLVFLEGPVSSR